MKRFIVDTCVLIDDPDCIFKFGANEVVVPFTVIEELDRHKDKLSSTGEGARTALRNIYALSQDGKLSKGIKMESGGLFRIDPTDPDEVKLPIKIDTTIPDNKIVAVAYSNKRTKDKNGTIIITNDINLKIKAELFDLSTEPYENRSVQSTESLFDPFYRLETTTDAVDYFSENGSVVIDDDLGLHANQNVLMQVAGTKQTNLGRYDAISNEVKLIVDGKREISGIRGKNLGQRFALDQLMDDNIDLVSLLGRAGTGKTLLALAVGLYKVLSQQKYNRIVVARPIVTLDKGHEIGYLPGTMQDKLAPWTKPIIDNLEIILGDNEENPYLLMENRTIEIEALGYIRGRSISNAFIIIDEAQQLLPREAKAIITRVGENSKIVLTGDPFQVDNKYLDETTNGLSYTVSKFRNKAIAGHTILTKCERSSLASAAAEIM